MKIKTFIQNTHALSVMYDAIFFVVLVSFAGAILLPAVMNQTSVQTSVEKHRETSVDNALQTYLTSRANKLSYKIGGDFIDDAAGNLGIDNSSEGLYGSIMNWLLAREQLHKNHAQLIAENLGCQFRLPLSFLGTNRFNIFTGEYDRILNSETTQFFSTYLGDKYRYNLSAIWHPIKGIGFGGEIYLGDKPPQQNTYVARTSIIMPYSPKITIGEHEIIFTKHWLKQKVFNISETLHSSLTQLNNISYILQEYGLSHEPFDVEHYAKTSVDENISSLVFGFLIDGIVNETGIQVFPGIVNMTLDYGFSKLKKAYAETSEDVSSVFLGESLSMVQDIFSSLNSSAAQPLEEMISDTINQTIQDMFGFTSGSILDTLDLVEHKIKENVTMLLHGFIDPYIGYCVDFIFQIYDQIIDVFEYVCDWLFERISIDRAEVVLTIWEARG